MKPCSVEGCHRTNPKSSMCSTHTMRLTRAKKRFTITCAHCGQQAQVSSRPTQMYCSLECRYSFAATRSGGQSKPKVPPTTSWTCLRCGQQCNRVPTKGSRPKYCNQRCAAGATFARRRARLLAAYVEEVSPADVFKADGYRCYLCHKMTDRTKSVPHKRAPTVDHVIPLSKGGLHERVNCRTACHSCNCAKQDRGGGEQLLLLAI